MRRTPIHHESHSSGILHSRLMPILACVIFSIFVIIAIINTFVSSKEYTADIITHDVKKLAEILHTIDNDCGILSFDYQRNPINFLNTVSFVSSEVGPVNLVHPENWKGPYLQDNPTIQNKEYVIIRTKYGYFITPDNGVKLPNGKIIGTDILINEDANIPEMMHDKDLLEYQGASLAVPLELKRLSMPVLPFALD